MRRRLAGIAIFIAVAAAASLLHPIIIAAAAALESALLGWTEGNHYQPSQSYRRLLLAFPASPPSIVAAKALSGLAVWLFLALVVAPPVALSALAWGVKAGALAACVLSWLACFYASLCAGFVSSLVFVRSEGVPGLVLIFLWLIPTAFIRPLAPANPFVQAWGFFREANPGELYLGMAATSLAATALLAAAVPIIAAARRKQDGR
jgi:hypothetical protein